MFISKYENQFHTPPRHCEKQFYTRPRHCEERSDEAIQHKQLTSDSLELPRYTQCFYVDRVVRNDWVAAQPTFMIVKNLNYTCNMDDIGKTTKATQLIVILLTKALKPLICKGLGAFDNLKLYITPIKTYNLSFMAQRQPLR